ncbi:putative O-methyltransferase, family 2 [Candidatus Nitrospira nitrificans]|uniref:Putative O-methyltransferase, family 2 n=1 Tax=Candidatus Nitrospira nitrificans TaxID=1742973 RepID=A0A0S4L5F4_9BACT|nr:putative O-methyltransferase, family 2 [Candidatus Nitrospira nitrificans]
MVLQANWTRIVTRRITTFDEFREAVSAYRLPRVLLVALELDLFTAVGDRAWTIPDLAKELKVSERGLSIVCRNLAAVGVLRKKGDGYRNSRLGATALNADHHAYRGGYLNLIKSHWGDWIRLLESVRSGLPIDHDVPDGPDYRRQFTWAMHHRTLEIAPAIAAQIPLADSKTLLDLGGGPGTYAMAFLAKHSMLRATVCDREAAIDVAKEIAATHKARRRLSYLPLDFCTETIPGTYDVIWYSNVLHIYSPEENLAIFRRAQAALRPGGRFIIQDAFLRDREGLYPVEASLFAVSMLLFTRGGNTYSVLETARWLKEAGFVRVKQVPLKKGTEDWEGGILEASVPGPHPKTTVRRTGSSRNRKAR